jgi:hypothetical protein
MGVVIFILGSVPVDAQPTVNRAALTSATVEIILVTVIFSSPARVH